MSTGTRFQSFQVRDFECLRAMVEALYAEDIGGQPMSMEKLRRTVAVHRRRPGTGRFILFHLGSESVGYGLVVPRWSNEHGGMLAIVDELYVAPAWRGRGIASAFLGEVPRLAGEHVVGVELEVTVGNELGLAFYRRLGFRQSPNLHLFKGARDATAVG